MALVNKLIILLVLFILVDCETNPPNQLESNFENAIIQIDSNIEGAKIFVDNVFTGEVTPANIQLGPGSYDISIRKEGYVNESKRIDVENSLSITLYFELNLITSSKIVLLEDFANVSCDPCVISNKLIEESIDLFDGQLIAIKFSTNFPSPIDPFYLHNRNINDNRMSYYGILLAPTIIIDGLSRPVATDAQDLQDKINERLEVPSKFNLQVSDSIDGSNYLANITTELLSPEFDYSECRLFNYIVEDQISFTQPPGSNGEIDFYNVVRATLPSFSNGINITFADSSVVEFNFSTAINPEWDMNKISIITFVQNIQTKEIYQCAKTK